jgi:energy-converting hydrogenase A subunit M
MNLSLGTRFGFRRDVFISKPLVQPLLTVEVLTVVRVMSKKRGCSSRTQWIKKDFHVAEESRTHK